ncbi:hypothetical protein [Gluconobacter roseus]|uniref:hypothetical protein n=1 Tax=Gluconobacter roseus TaxID=586239 RepID=UPI0038CF91D9
MRNNKTVEKMMTDQTDELKAIDEEMEMLVAEAKRILEDRIARQQHGRSPFLTFLHETNEANKAALAAKAKDRG